MSKKMSVMGIGHKAGIIAGVYFAITVLIDYMFPTMFRIAADGDKILFKVGIIMAVAGFALNLAAASRMLKAYKSGRLATKGLYAIFLNPMYTMQILVTLPGITLLFNSWLVMTTTIVAFITVKVLVKEEERYLEDKFGNVYRDYRKKVLIKIL
jgi:protein-S-isoprenylcysteine O-methyltransferase Ste14